MLWYLIVVGPPLRLLAKTQEADFDRRIGQTSGSPPAKPGVYPAELTDSRSNQAWESDSASVFQEQPGG